MTESAPAKAAPKKENFIVNLVCNVVVPGILLNKGGDWLPKAVPPSAILVAALMFPISYFLFDYGRRRVANPISIFGFVGTLVSGAIGLMKIDPFWFAVKEAAFPAVIGVVMYVTQAIKRPLVKAFVWNDTVLNTERIQEAVAGRNAQPQIDTLFSRATHLLAPAFLLSAIAHYLLARHMVTAHPENAAQQFNEQLGKFNLIAWPAIILPSFAYLVWLMLRFLKRVREVAGITEEELYRA